MACMGDTDKARRGSSGKDKNMEWKEMRSILYIVWN